MLLGAEGELVAVIKVRNGIGLGGWMLSVTLSAVPSHMLATVVPEVAAAEVTVRREMKSMLAKWPREFGIVN
jgi:hypothetical protein